MPYSHTPGPWEYAGSMNGTTMRIIRDFGTDEMSRCIAMNGGEGCIATVELPQVGIEAAEDEPEALHNARLIADAPRLAELNAELAEALRACLTPIIQAAEHYQAAGNTDAMAGCLKIERAARAVLANVAKGRE